MLGRRQKDDIETKIKLESQTSNKSSTGTEASILTA